MACKYGKLKSPRGRKKCRKAPRAGRRGRGRARICRFGRLKNPKGSRVCRKKRRHAAPKRRWFEQE